MMNFFTFGGINSNEYGVHISGSGTYNAPKRNVTMQAVPGRNGSITFDNGNFENITVKYPAFVVNTLPDSIKKLRNMIGAKVGYQRLEDTYDPEVFRLGIYKSGLDVKTSGYANRHGEFTIEFDCKPQRFLKLGENEVEFAAPGVLFNPTEMNAKPFIRVYGTGAGMVGVGDYIINISAIDEYIDIDCELMDAFKGSVNCNNKVIFSDDVVDLGPGENAITFSGDITQVDITPRWWIL